MNSTTLATVITVAVAVFFGQLVYKRVFEPRFTTLLKEQTKEPEYRSPVDSFLDSY